MGKHEINRAIKILGCDGVQMLGICAGLGKDERIFDFGLLFSRRVDVFSVLLGQFQTAITDTDGRFFGFGNQFCCLLLGVAVCFRGSFLNGKYACYCFLAHRIHDLTINNRRRVNSRSPAVTAL